MLINKKTVHVESKTLKIKYNPDFICLNEIFLKPNDEYELKGYKIIRAERPFQNGCGTVLCIKENIKGTAIDMTNFQDHSYSTCFLMSAKNNLKITIVSIYITPQECLKKSYSIQ